MTNKPIDLGALQDAHLKARAGLTSALVVSASADRKVELAQAAADRAKDKVREAEGKVQLAKTAMLDGARTASNF